MEKFTQFACINLKSDTDHVPEPENREFWSKDTSSTRHFWCIRTMSSIGPDSSVAVPEHCDAHRSCFEKR